MAIGYNPLHRPTRQEMWEAMQGEDNTIMNLPYDEGDIVFVYDLADSRAFRGTVKRLALPKKKEWAAIIITIEDRDGNLINRSIDKTAFIEQTQDGLRKRLHSYFSTKAQTALNMDLITNNKVEL